VGVSCLGGNTTLCKPRSELNVDIIYIPIKICGVYGVYLRVYEVPSVSLGLVFILCVNALFVNAWVMWNLSDVVGVFLALSLSLALCVYALACQGLCNVEFVGCCWRYPGTITITGTICICRRP